MSGIITATNLQISNIKSATGNAAITVADNGNMTISGNTTIGGTATFSNMPTGVIKTFTSAETTIAASTKTTLAHSLGAIPFQFDLYLICKTAEYGYVVGDIIKVTQGFHSTAGTTAIGAMMSADATNIYLTTGGNAAGGMFKGFNQDTAADITFTNANHKMIVKAWV